MPTYRYQPGDRPLDGYTLRAPAGRGGFGEVYFAESDAGREVALKALYVTQGYDEIELRGIRHCMNLKSPHLVSIFDVKTGNDGTPFVVMEYVAGPSLRDLLNDSPQGLGPDKAAFFLREVAKGLGHLHGYGVVHRDLKPANIFYEDGYVKIGDYGLSKLMSADPVASQTVTVGTVHYMAPEIGVGKYDKSIDLYALGCLLYEMLTGKVPYSGNSPSEVLMKHLQAEPELDDVPEAFAKVIRKALQKDPADRYASATEMVEDLFGTEHVRNSVSQLSADELSVIAERVGRKVAATTPPPIEPARAAPAATPPGPQESGPWDLPTLNPTLDKIGRRLNSSLGLDGAFATRWPPYAGWVYLALSGVVAFCASLPLAGVSGVRSAVPGSIFFLMGLGVPLGWSLARTRHRVSPDSSLKSRFEGIWLTLLIYVVVGYVVLGMIGDGMSNRLAESLAVASLIGIVTIVTIRWTDYTRPDRERSFAPGLSIGAGMIAGSVALFFVPAYFPAAFALVVIAALGAQLLSPVSDAGGKSATAVPHPSSPSTPRQAPASPAAFGAAPATPPDHHASSASHSSHASRHSRLAALLLCLAIFPTFLGGLHRLYTGRWVTGLIWLCTFGLLGVGQLIDGVRILTGEFDDHRGRPVNRWGFSDHPPSAASGSGLNRTWTPRIAGRVNPLAMILHLAGIMLLLLGVALVIPVFFSIPQAFETLPVLADAHREIARELDYTGWPDLLQRLLVLGAVAAFLAGTIAVAVARRGGPLHLTRALAAGGLLLSFTLVVSGEYGQRAIYPEEYATDLDHAGVLATVDALLTLLIRPELFIGLCWVGVAGLLLVIPARRRRVDAHPVVKEPNP